MFLNLYKNKGFTLIELLVVVAIIGILSSVVLTSLTSVKKRARDTKRKQDTMQVRNALELYYLANNSYPSTGAVSATPGSADYYRISPTNHPWAVLSALAPTYISVVPFDPFSVDIGPWPWHNSSNAISPPNNTGYNTMYTYSSDGSHYIFCSWLENSGDTNTLKYQDVTNPYNTSQKLYADVGYSAMNYCVAQ